MKQLILIEFKDIFLKFKNKIILENFNLQIHPLDKIVVSGPSGMGKSTLFNLLLGLKQAQSGEIFFKQKKITPDNIRFLRSKIAYVDQDVSLGNGLVKDLIADYFSFKINKKNKFDSDKFYLLLNEFSLEKNILDQNINELSGGERQRLGLVMALLLDRPILLLDEVSSSLDQNLVKKAIDKILKLDDKTVILIAHNQEWQKRKGVRVFNFKDKKWQ